MRTLYILMSDYLVCVWLLVITKSSNLQIANVEAAHRYLKHFLKSPKSSHEVRIAVDSSLLNEATERSAGSNSARSTTDSRQSMLSSSQLRFEELQIFLHTDFDIQQIVVGVEYPI